MPRKLLTPTFARSTLAVAISGVLGSAVYTPSAYACTTDASSQTFTVTGTSDVTDANDGVVTLREAIEAADLRIGCDTVNFDPTLNGQTITLTDSTNIDIDDDVNVVGPGSALLTISHSSVNSSRSAFNTYASDLSVSGLTFDGNDSSSAAIDMIGNGTLTADDLVVQNIVNDNAIEDGRVMSISNSTFRNITNGSGLQTFSAEDLDLVNVTFENIHSDNFGAPVYLDTPTDGTVDVDNTSITGSSGQQSGGIRLGVGDTSQITIRNTTLAGNTGSTGGGGIYISNAGAGASIEIRNSTISGNTTVDSAIGGSLSTGAGGGLRIANTANDFAMNIIQSTFSGNDSASAGGGIYIGNRGANAAININNSTVTLNEAEFGGGLFANDSGADINLSHTVIGANTSVQGTPADEDVGVSEPTGPVTGGTFNASYSFTGVAGVNVLNTIGSQLGQGDPGLSALADGPGTGSTQIHMPESNSPLVDMGNVNLPDDGSFDQDGRPRFVNGRIDIGASEYNANRAPTVTPITAATAEAESSFSFSLSDFFDDPDSDALTYTIQNANELPGGITIGAGVVNAVFSDSDIGTYTVNYQACDAEPLCIIGMGLLSIIESDDGSSSSALGPLSVLGLLAALVGFRRRRA